MTDLRAINMLEAEMKDRLEAKDKELAALREKAEEWKYLAVKRNEVLQDAIIQMKENGARAETAERERDEAREALTPSASTKAAYIGEFHFEIEDRDEDGEECSRKVTVPWTTIKEIMAAISKRAALAITGKD